MWLVSHIKYPKCGNENDEEHLDADLKDKKIICSNCLYKKRL